MNALDYAATYAVYVISTGVTIFVILRGWAYVLSAGNE
jgi:hypothetical protein